MTEHLHTTVYYSSLHVFVAFFSRACLVLYTATLGGRTIVHVKLSIHTSSLLGLSKVNSEVLLSGWICLHGVLD